MRILFLLSLFIFLVSENIYSQGCCSGGNGCPIAGGTSQGVLSEKQLELNANYQYFNSSKFFAQDRDTARLFDNLNTNYLYFRTAYGVTKNLTMSVEAGYFINKTQIGLEKRDTIESGGIADIILFPRYMLYSKTKGTNRTEITLGLGLKIPIGTYNDSLVAYTNPRSGEKKYITSPPVVQPTNGSQDFIFYGFFLKSFKNFRMFLNTIYVKKGWNPLGLKFGNYANVSLFAGKTFFEHLGATIQIKGEWIGKIQSAPKVKLASYYIDKDATGGKSVFIIPQISYNYKSVTIYCLSEIPIYQYLNKAQIGSQYQVTFGVSYRFFIKKMNKE
ncbi:MAG: hypothetical protein A2046_05160 [Bacteroidetes bacterium GWA2_30_7]|nr:MAG: hypothetical protein A2046_05160 [Bacteroidetes bacterium GWA2_30_7]